jgi:hypothetical protein
VIHFLWQYRSVVADVMRCCIFPLDHQTSQLGLKLIRVDSEMRQGGAGA